MRFALVGLNHKTASLEVREKIAFSEGQINEALLALKRQMRGSAGGHSFVEECIIVSTCNRTEIYCVYNCDIFNPNVLAAFLAERAGLALADIEPYLYIFDGVAAVDHLFRVAAGLESMVIGEHQIAGQLKTAYYHAVACQTNGTFTNKLFHAAFHVAKRVRSETQIGVGSTSVAQTACDFAERFFGELGGKRALVVGAGDTAEIAAKRLKERGAGEVVIINRTFKRGQDLAKKLETRVAVWEQMTDALSAADIVVSATSAPDAVLTSDLVGTALVGRDTPLFMIDLAVPRDIAPEVKDLPQVTLSNLDDLQAHVAATVQRRCGERHKALKIIDDAKNDFLTWHHTQQMSPTIVELRSQAERVRTSEIDKLRTHLSDDEFAKVDAATRAIVNKLLHNPIITLKQAAAGGDSMNMKAVEDMVRTLMGIGA